MVAYFRKFTITISVGPQLYQINYSKSSFTELRINITHFDMRQAQM